jgi:multiple sugar transport system ATP-binding protein
MASLKLEHIYKVYPNGHKAVSDFNMDIEDGEFIVFVGPSGCGKSTTLRMIAGLEDISSGELYIGDTLVNDVQPKDRDIAMVFQNYALYPHMTVYENMAFGLTLRKVPRTEIHEKVMWAADVLGLSDYLDRKPKAMSGGQRQRVSLGRAILRNPKVMLLDEPLSNLDAKLRGQMRSMISKLHQQLKTTFIYVTHDQVEAMTLGTRVVVMKLGRVQQIDSPQNLYDHPINKFVAGFIGTPQMNFFNVTLLEDKDGVSIRWSDCEQPALRITKEAVLKAEKKYLQGDKPITLGFRCEAVSAEEEELAKGDNIVDVTISHFEELGNETLIYGDLKEIEGLGGESKTSIIIKASSKMGHVPGDVIKARIDVERIHLFDSESEMTIIPPVPDHNVLPVSIENGKMDLFGKITKPESIPVDLLKEGTISLPLTAFRVGSGEVKAKVKLVEQHKKEYLALVNANGKDFFVFVDENTKVGDTLQISIDYSKAAFRDNEEKLVASPLADRDNLHATFVNFKTAFEDTQDKRFTDIRDQRVGEVSKKYEEIEANFNSEKEAALAEAQQKQAEVEPQIASKKAEVDKNNNELKEQIKKLTQEYRSNVKEVKAKHKEIRKEAIKKIEDQYKEMWAKEKEDFKKSMATNKDADSRRQRRDSYSIFKESFPQMKANDLERKINALEFDEETEENALKAKLNQQKSTLKDQIKQNSRHFEEECYPLKLATKEYQDKEKQLASKKADDLLHAELIFFLKFEKKYFLIPDDITARIIQGLGNKVFTKVFRVEVPHNGYIEADDGIEFKVVSDVNYGDVKLYKCTGELYGEKVVVYLNKEREIELGSTVKLVPSLEKTEIYEDELNIRLY